jgi:hypothetical protein
VTDRNFHRDQLASLTGIEAEGDAGPPDDERDPPNCKRLFSGSDSNTPIQRSCLYWLENIYRPAVAKLEPLSVRDRTFRRCIARYWSISGISQARPAGRGPPDSSRGLHPELPAQPAAVVLKSGR